MDVTVPQNLVPMDLPDGSIDGSYWTIPHRSDAERLGLNRTDHYLDAFKNTPIILNNPPPEYVSFYMDTGSTYENQWFIGHLISKENPLTGSITPEELRSNEWFPISRAYDFNVIPRDIKGNRFVNLSDNSTLTLNLSFTYHG